MHLDVELVAESVRRLASLLVPQGVLYLAWRVNEDESLRDQAGRLYSSFKPSLVLNALDGMEIVLNQQSVSASSRKVVHRVGQRLSLVRRQI